MSARAQVVSHVGRSPKAERFERDMLGPWDVEPDGTGARVVSLTTRRLVARFEDPAAAAFVVECFELRAAKLRRDDGFGGGHRARSEELEYQLETERRKSRKLLTQLGDMERSALAGGFRA